MKRIYPFIFVTILTLAALACGISNPLPAAQQLAQTAEAAASAIPSGLPQVTQYMNPQGKPVSEWNGIPIMSQATAGQEFGKGTYSYRVSGVTEDQVQTFYSDKLKAAGWDTALSGQGAGVGGLMVFTKGSQVLTITISKSDQDFIVLLATQ